MPFLSTVEVGLLALKMPLKNCEMQDK